MHFHLSAAYYSMGVHRYSYTDSRESCSSAETAKSEKIALNDRPLAAAALINSAKFLPTLTKITLLRAKRDRANHCDFLIRVFAHSRLLLCRIKEKYRRVVIKRSGIQVFARHNGLPFNLILSRSYTLAI